MSPENSPLAPAPLRKPSASKLPRRLRPLFAWIPFVSTIPYFAFALASYFAAIQVQVIDPAGKVGALAVVTSLAGVAALIAQPVIGVISDRTRSRFGSRNPWILFGTVVGAAGLLTAGLSGTVAVLTIGICLVQFGFNALQGPLSAILPDRVPERFRGRYSTLAGFGVLLGSVLGPVIGSMFVDELFVGYVAIAGVVLFLVVLFLLTVPERGNRDVPRERFSARAFFGAFWINPLRYPDFFWGFLGRFLLFGGYNLLGTYVLYIAQDYIGLSFADAQAIVPLLGVATLPGVLLGTAIAGPLSDRIGRRKPLVLVAGLIITAGAVVPLLMPTVAGLLVGNVLLGVGFGTFVAVDQALMSSVLPDPERYGKDLGVLNIAAALPVVIAPAAAGAIVLLTGSYAMLYVTTAIACLLGALAVIPIKGAR